MDRPLFDVGRQRRSEVPDLAHDVEQPTKYRVSDRHGDRLARQLYRRAATKSRSRLQRDRAHGPLINVALYFRDQKLRPIPFDS